MKFFSLVRLFGERLVGQRAARKRRARAHRPQSPGKGLQPLVETLEDRTLMSVLPPVDTADPRFIDRETNTSLNTPVIAVSPVNPQKLVAVYTEHTPRPSFNHETDRSVLRGQFSTDGGQTWAPLFGTPASNADNFFPTNLPDPTSVNRRQYLQSTQPSVAIDRNENVYVVYLQHSNNMGPRSPVLCNAIPLIGLVTEGECVSGSVVLQKLNISDNALRDQRPDVLLTNNVLYRWVHQDPAMYPFVAVDNTVAFTDPETNVTQPAGLPGTVYVAWNTNNAAPASLATSPFFNPNVIKLISSADGGVTFSSPLFISDGGIQGPDTGTQRNIAPQIVVSQGGNNGVPPGRVTLVWSAADENVTQVNVYQNPRIVSDTVIGGSSSITFPGGFNPQIAVAVADASQNWTLGTTNQRNQNLDNPVTTTVPLQVNLPANFTITDLDVTVALEKPNVQDTRIVLITPSGIRFTLLENAQGRTGTISPTQGIQNQSADNLGVLNGAVLGTVFDQQASVEIVDPSNIPPYAGNFQPEAPSNLNALVASLTPADRNGTWQLEITDFRSEPLRVPGPNGSTSSDNNCNRTVCAGPNTGTLRQFILRFSNTQVTNTPDVPVPGNAPLLAVPANLRSNGSLRRPGTGGVVNTFPIVASLPPGAGLPDVSPDRGVLPGLSVAVDNTLGSFSQHQGRIYVAYTGGSATAANDNSEIFLSTSDDGGLTWVSRGRVNDDNPFRDGFSQGNRPQFMPTAAVDQSTGTLVISYFDARHDAARSRVGRMITTSIDGGATFGPTTFLNQPNDPLDTVTQQTVTLGPIPDNQGRGNPLPTSATAPNLQATRDLVFAYGDRQGMVVAGGRVYATWAGNQNAGFLGILMSTSFTGDFTTIPTGPRIVTSDMGPVTAARVAPGLGTVYNATFAPDGTRMLDGFVVTFDRWVDPGTFGPDDVTVIYRSASTSGNQPGTSIPISAVIPLDPVAVFTDPVSGTVFRMATQFLVRFPPQAGVGTYSYTVGARVNDRIRQLAPATVTCAGDAGIRCGNLMDQNADAISGTPRNDRYAVPLPLDPNAAFVPIDPDPTNPDPAQFYYRPPFHQESLPLIIPGPYVQQVSVPNIYDAPSTQTNLPLPHITTSDLDIAGVPASRRITNVNVLLTLTHPRVGDLVITLIAPDGTEILLSQNRGGGGANFTGTVFSDISTDPNSAGNPITTAQAPFSGSFLPEVPLTLLDGKSPNGRWRLKIEDGAPGALGTLVHWSLEVETEDSYSAPFEQVNLRLPPAGDGGLGSPSAVSTITVSGVPADDVVKDIDVTVSLLHNRVSDLALTLIDPLGREVRLVQNRGGFGSNYTNTTFDDQAAASIVNGVAPFTGSFVPEEPLASLHEISPNGDWRLRIDDLDGSFPGETGTLLGWSIKLRSLNTSYRPAASELFKPIPQVTASTIVVSGQPSAARISGLTVNMSLLAQIDGDLVIKLVAPDGSQIRLADRVGGSGQNFINTTFTDRAGTPIATAPAPFLGFFRPTDPLSLLLGRSPNGRWTLVVEDTAGRNVGQLLNWSLTLETANVYTVEARQFNEVNKRIPDDPDLTVTQGLTRSFLAVQAPDVEAITDVQVNVLLEHTRLNDLTLTLVAPDRTTRVPLVLAGQLSGQNLTNTIFSDRGATSITNGSAPYRGAFQPVTPLSTLVGGNPNGSWELEIFDNATGGTGILLGWSLTLTTRNTQTNDNLVLNNTVRAIDVRFDRAIEPASVSPLDGLRLMGPSGIIPSAYREYNSTDVGRAIPDVGGPSPTNPNSYLSSTLVVPDDFVIGDLRVRLHITHTRNRDLTAYLVSPIGTRIQLFDRVPGDPVNAVNNQNFANTEFDDSALVSIQDPDLNRARAPYSRVFRPLESLSVLKGQRINGTWTLVVVDNELGGAGGRLNSWSLISTPYTVTPNPNGDEGPGQVRTFRIGLPSSQEASGTYTLELGPGIRAVNRPIPGAPTGDLDTNLNAGLDALRDTISSTTLPSTPTRFTSTNVPLLLPAGQTVIALLDDVDEDFVIENMTVQVDITHPIAADLQISLVTPYLDPRTNQPLEIQLARNVPVPGGGANYSNTIFDDNAPVPISAGAAPFPDRYRPMESLSLLQNRSAKGLRSDGSAWRLKIVNTSANAVGRLNSFGVNFIRSVAPIRTRSRNVPVAITQGGTATSTLQVTDNFVIQGTTVTLDITHPNVPDLEATLIAPDGTRVRLFRGVGTTGSRANFTGTVFDDRARNGLATTPIQNGAAPFFGRFNPEQPLGTFDGKGSFGTWTLEIVNTGGFTGTLNSWSLLQLKPVPTFGVGELNGDRALAHFRIFTMDPTNPVSHTTWTAVGPASSNQLNPNGQVVRRGVSGQIGALAVDPSDPSGNTVFVAGVTGGIWKTVNFLTTDPDGPTYIPLTDFGPTFSLNIGNMAVVGRNNDPHQSLVVAVTGSDEVIFPGLIGTPVPHTPGVGLLLSQDGGATWNLFDSTDNTLPFDQRDHLFVGSVGYKVVADPRPSPAGEAILYMAISDPTDRAGTANGRSGIWRSVDSGRRWVRVRAGDATDVVLDPNSGFFDALSNPTGNLQIVYGAFRGQGVFLSADRGQVWNQVLGGVNNPLINGGTVVNPPTPDPNGPNGAKGRILLAKPDLVPSSDPNAAVKNLLYEGWLYALVATAGGGADGLYVTKDFGQNWTRIRTFGPVPTNGSTGTEVTPIGGGTGNTDISLTLDPTDPTIVYIGGNGRAGSLFRIDTKDVSDAHAFYLAHNRSDGGQVRQQITEPIQAVAGTGFLHMVQDPLAPFVSNSAFTAPGAGPFANTGVGARWIPLDDALKPDPFDPASVPTANQHRLIAYRDPTTGHARLIIGDEEGVFTAVDRGDGTLVGSIGSVDGLVTLATRAGDVPVVSGTRNGNLQLTQFFAGAAQPSLLAAQIAGALFHGTAQTAGFPASDPNILENGVITWTGEPGVGGGVATDQRGTGTLYEYRSDDPLNNPIPNLNFFQVNGVGRTFGLLQQLNDPQWPVGRGLNFAVNPLDGDNIVISSTAGRIFATTTQGRFWLQIGAPGDLDGTNAQALAFGAPDPSGVAGSDPLNFMIFAGTNGGRIFVTFTGGGSNPGVNQWFDISAGLDGSGVRAIVTNPSRGSREAYAVTRNGVYHIKEANPNAVVANPADKVWQNITGNLFQVAHELFRPFNDPDSPILVDTQARPFRLESIVADWRYLIPDNANALLNPVDPSQPRPTHPVLYVAGEGGVYRSMDNGATWSLFPGPGTSFAGTTFDDEATRPITDGSAPYIGSFRPVAPLATFDGMNANGTWTLIIEDTRPGNRGTLRSWGVEFSGRPYRLTVLNVVTVDATLVPGTTQVNPGVVTSDIVVPDTFFVNDVNVQLEISHGRIADLNLYLQAPDGRRVQLIAAGASNDLEGGMLPNAHVVDLDLALGNVNPTTGRNILADRSNPDPRRQAVAPDLLLATTYGRGAFGVVVSPVIVAAQVEQVTNIVRPTIRGMSSITAFGNTTRITIYDQTDPIRPRIIGGFDRNNASTDNPSNWTNGDGLFSITIDPGVFKNDGSTDGLRILGIQASDDAGAYGPIHSVSYLLDTTPFITGVRLDPGSDSGESSADSITNVLQPVLTGTVAQATPVEVIFVDLTGNPNVNDPNAPVIARGRTNQFGQFAIPVDPGVFPTGAPNAVRTIGVRATNGLRLSTDRQSTPTVSFTLDTIRPGVPTVNLSVFSDTGSSNTDHVTRINTPTFTGSGEPGARIRVFAQNTSGGPVFQVNNGLTFDVVDQTGSWSANVTPGALADGTYFITVEQFDLAGNVSDRSDAMVPFLQINSRGIQQPVIRLDPSSDTATPNDNITAAIPQLYTGTVEAGSTVLIRVTTNGATRTFGPFDASQVGVAQTSVQAGLTGTYRQVSAGNFEFTLNLADGSHSLVADATNVAGTGAQSNPARVTIDRSALDADRKYIREIYQLALGRPGTIAEWNFWLTILARADGRVVVSNLITRSPEARTFLVKTWYGMFLGRQPVNGEEQFFVRAMLAGATEEDTLALMLGSGEYFFRAPRIIQQFGGPASDATFVQGIYSQLLGRPATGAEVNFWLPIVATNGRVATARALLGSTEYRVRYVTLQYFDLLRRTTFPTLQELVFWALSPFDLTGIRIGLMTSEEFFTRAGGFRQ